MSGTFYPPPIDFPDGWPVGNSIGPLTSPYAGPTLGGGAAVVSFQLGSQLRTSTAGHITIAAYVGPDIPVPGQENLFVFESGAWVQVTSGVGELYTPLEVITVNVFEPNTAGDIPYKLWADFTSVVPNDLKKRDLLAGIWHICPVPPV